MLGRSAGRAAGAVLVACAAPFAAILLVGLRQGNAFLSVSQIVVFYVVPFSWLLCTAVALRSRVELRVSLAVAVLSIGVATGAGELLAGAVLRRADMAAAPPPLREDVLRLRVAGTDAYPRIPGSGLVQLAPVFRMGSTEVHPITTAPGGTTVLLCKENGPLISYLGDSFGFRNPSSAWANSVEIALVGDSYTAGVCVDDDQDMASNLRRTHSVLNVGVSGAGPLQELAIVREYLTEVTPSVVVWVYYAGNDLWELSQELQHDWLADYLNAGHSQRLADFDASIDQSYREWTDSLLAAGDATAGGPSSVDASNWMTDALRLRSMRRLTGFRVPFPRRDPSVGMLTRILALAHDHVRSWNGRFLFVYLPSYDHYDFGVGYPHGRDQLLTFLHDTGIPSLDLDSVFRATEDPRLLWAGPQGHLTPEGYRIAATAIGRAVASFGRVSEGASPLSE